MPKQKITIYHNPRCTKSREACSLLPESKYELEIIEYLKTPPTETELKGLLKMLGIKAEELVRKKEPLFIEKYKGKKISETEWVKILCKNPILIERPIVIKNNKAIIARPAEKLKELLAK